MFVFGISMRLFLLFFLALIGCQFERQLVSNALGQSPSADWREQRMVLEHTFGEELQTIALWCREQGINQQAELTLGLFQNRDLGRQYIFLPSEQSMPTGSLVTVPVPAPASVTIRVCWPPTSGSKLAVQFTAVDIVTLPSLQSASPV